MYQCVTTVHIPPLAKRLPLVQIKGRSPVERQSNQVINCQISENLHKTYGKSLGTFFALSGSKRKRAMALATFTGGPYDGLKPIDWHEYRLGTEVEVPISAELLRLLTGEQPGAPTALSGVAVYRLEVTRLGVRFHFLKRRAVKPAEWLLMETWRSHVVRRLQAELR